MTLEMDFNMDTMELTLNDEPLRDFYIKARRRSGIPVSTLETRCGLNHPILANIEKPNFKGYQSRAVRPMLIALMTMGYTFSAECMGSQYPNTLG